jgi:hypothetical protein
MSQMSVLYAIIGWYNNDICNKKMTYET